MLLDPNDLGAATSPKQALDAAPETGRSFRDPLFSSTKGARRVGRDCTGYHASLPRAELYGEGGVSPAAPEPSSDDPDSDAPAKAECPIALVKLPEGEEAMSPLAIAELTGKQHGHVLRDADKMLKDLGLVGDPKFGATYLTSQNKQARCLNLPYNLTLTLVAGYDAVLRKRVIDEWIVLREMVGKPAPGAPPVSSDPTLVAILAQLTRQGEETQKRIEFEGERNDRANRQVLDRV